MNDTPLINSINSIEDFKRIPEARLDELAQEIRGFLVQKVSRTGGHLASNLGVVELTMALHRVFDSPKDRLIFDVGHQCYVHKLLTGRRDGFETLRSSGGMSGFPKRSESQHDQFNTGHSSTSVSAALGMLRAMKLRGEEGRVVAVIGDGALTGGMAFEALNDGGQSGLPLIVVLNDNNMSISRNVGALTNHLDMLRSSQSYISLKHGVEKLIDTIPGIGTGLHRRLSRLKSRFKYFILPNVLFEELGFTYLGPVNGHDTHSLMRILSKARELEEPVIIHALTVKGKGYAPAEEQPSRFHGIGKFEPDTGEQQRSASYTNSNAAGDVLTALAEQRGDIAVITAAMCIGTGMERFEKAHPERFFDVGIAEQHAVTMAAGLAAGGMRPVVAVYSSFLQRAYDQMLHDVALQELPVLFAVDRAGLVGEDGETHHGIYDIAYSLTLPNVDIYSPSSINMLKEMLVMALEKQRPTVVRYNRGALPQAEPQAVEYGRWQELKSIAPVTVIATGRLVATAQRAVSGTGAGLVDARFIRPMDEEMLERIAAAAQRVITLEDGIVHGGLGSCIAERLGGIPVRRMGIPADTPVVQASVREQDYVSGINEEAVREMIMAAVEELA